MAGTAWLQPLTGSRAVRRLADAGFVRYAHLRVAALDRLGVGRTQADTLLKLVRHAKDTRFGRDHDFAGVRTVADYRSRVPLRDYEFFWTTYWKDAYPKLDDVTWPGHCPYYALSSGTTSGTTKYIPVTRAMVRSNGTAARTTLALFRHAHPDAKLFTGKFFFLGGSTDLRPQADGSRAGDLSGIAAKEVPDALRPYAFPPYDMTLISDWEVKVQQLAERSAKERITALSGVPSWMLILFQRLKQVTGKRTVADVWPDLRLVIHGGTKFDSYRELFRQEIGSDAVRFCEVYPCSEGFIATEDPRHPGLMRLVPDHDVFFEFVPADDLDDHGRPKPDARRHAAGEVELGVRYAVAITSCAGVWAYLVGDTVTFESRDPPLLRFSGRTKNFLSAFGEHLIEEEVEKAVAFAARGCGATATNHHVGPVFPADPAKPGHHLYLIEFRTPPADLDRFTRMLDEELIRLNEDYDAHRKGDLTMRRPVVRPVPPGGFDAWMKARGKLGGQNKVPRMDNGGAMTRELSDWFEAKRGS